MEDRLKLITSTPEVLALAVTENNKIVVLHSIKNMGGTLICPNNKVVALLGTSHDAKPVELDLDSALMSYKSKAPKFEDIKDAVTREELEKVPVLPPPFQAKMIIEAARESEEDELDPIDLAEKAIFVGRAFDTEHDGDEEYNEGGLEKSEQLIRWLLSVYHGFVSFTKFVDGVEEDEEVQTYRIQQHEHWIVPPLRDPRRIERLELEISRLAV
jgi:hypothetical protein